MKRKIVICFCIFLGFAGFTNLAAEEIKVYAPVAQSFLIDEKDYIRYSPVNIFDDNSASVYAVTYSQINRKKALLEIYFSEPARFDKLSIKAGYFDERYFQKNNRIKNLKLKILNCKNIDFDKTIELNDVMSPQNIYEGDVILATKIVLYADEIFPGSKWNDLVISDLQFYLNGKKLKVSFDKGQCLASDKYTTFEYDDKGRLVYEYIVHGKSGCERKYYKYEDNKIFMNHVWMDDLPEDSNYVEVESVEEKLPGKEFYYKDKLVTAEKYTRNSDFYISQYLYDENNRLKSIVRICENSYWDEKYIEYSYNKKNQPEKKISYRDATIYKNRYE